ncbi:glycosyltransferase [Paraburkholderia sp. RL18-085-BIA-A]|uniref:glycosyltransferase n=1 Tax=Paraburkholderia sp. RL18-085-BIA-A TaxID=3031633 RepID=UPI0038BCA9BF
MVDNASEDNSAEVLRNLTLESGQPNLQIYVLTKEVDADTALWVGLENALGDYVVALDPLLDDISLLESMLEKATSGVDIVLAYNRQRPAQSTMYNLAQTAFDLLYRSSSGMKFAHEAPRYRLVSKRIVNFILQHPQPAIAYRHLPLTGGFSCTDSFTVRRQKSFARNTFAIAWIVASVCWCQLPARQCELLPHCVCLALGQTSFTRCTWC